MMNEGMKWLCMKYEVILLSASMFSERCTMLCSFGEKCDRQQMFDSVGGKGLKNAENDVKNHVSIQSYQLTPVQLERIRLSLTSTGTLKDFKLWTMILLGGHLFLRASEVCCIEIVDIFLDEVEFDESSPFHVKRFMIQVIRKNKKKYTYQFSRDDAYPKLDMVRTLLIYVHTCMYKSTSAFLFPKESNSCKSFAYDVFLSQLKLLSTRLFGVLCGKGVTTHTIRNLGYVLAIWGDGEMLEAVDDATHSTTTDTYQLYSRDTKRKYEIWKEDNNYVSGIDNVVGRWRKKMVKENKFARPVSGNDLSLQNIAHNYVLHVLCVKEKDPNFRNPMHLFHKSVVIGSSFSSDILKVKQYFLKYGEDDEKREVQEAFHRCMYRVRDAGKLKLLFYNYYSININFLFSCIVYCL